uniref:Syntaxin N-terminal domain-containing protein n=1 Tax=Mesocestoides corti TaxID=53468 RepID=A0A5K3EFK7_MESCO
MQQAVDYLSKMRPQLSSLLANYNLTCHSIGTSEDSNKLRHRLIQQRGALMTALTTIQANVMVVIEAQKRTPSSDSALIELCSYYVAFMDFALHSFRRIQRLMTAFPDVPEIAKKVDETRRIGQGIPDQQAATVDQVNVSEKERVDLVTDITTIKLLRNTVKLLRNRLQSGHQSVPTVPRLALVVQALISKRRELACRPRSAQSETGRQTDIPDDTTQAADTYGNLTKSAWLSIGTKWLFALMITIAITLLLSLLFVIIFVFAYSNTSD